MCKKKHKCFYCFTVGFRVSISLKSCLACVEKKLKGLLKKNLLMGSNGWRRFYRGESSSSSNSERRLRRRTNGGDGRLVELPPDLLHRIMLHVCGSDFEVYCRARSMTRTLRDVTNEEFFLREVDLFTMQTPNRFDDGITAFYINCQHRGNLSAQFFLGCCEFFRRGNLENGIAIIRESALRGYELSVYVYCNLRRILSPNNDVDLELVYPNRDLVRRMRAIIEYSPHRFWPPYQPPELYRQRFLALDIGVIERCRCAAYIPWNRMWDESVKEPSMCDVCFFTIHAYGFSRFILEKVMNWPLPYYF